MPEDQSRSSSLRALAALLDDAHFAVADELPDIVQRAWQHLGCTAVIHLVDYEQRHLRAWPPTGEPARPEQAINATLAGRVFRSGEAAVAAAREPHILWLPLLDGVERLGVLEVLPRSDVDIDDPERRAEFRWAAELTGHLVTLKAQNGDAIDAVRRTRSRTVAAELVWQLLPPLTFGCERLVVSGLLEPCYEIGGDVFDYAVIGSTAHLAIFDAMGHALSAGLISAAALSTYRACRRESRDLLETAERIDATLAGEFGDARFATGVIAELDLDSGRLQYVAAGHPHPLLLRRSKVVKQLAAGRRPPFGLPTLVADAGPVAPGEEWLEPEDAVLLYTDGVTEARGDAELMFGLDRLVDFLERDAASRQPAPEVLRQLVHAVLDHQQGRLQDDATLLLANWTTTQQKSLTPD